MKNKDLIFHMPKGKEEEEDYQTIMNNTDWSEIYEKEQKLRQKEYIKNQSLDDRGILNDIEWNSEPNKLIYTNKMVYAFVYHEANYALWAKRVSEYMGLEEWTEVTSLLDIPLFSYIELKKYAVAVGWIEEDDNNWLIEKR